ncbi:MAG: thioredoxin family protein [Alphaproteobacteria bacterium]|nr:thioredoxin family protein [Alphaproteobacteria bacterium]
MSLKYFFIALFSISLLATPAYAKESYYTHTQVDLISQYEAVDSQTPFKVLVKIRPQAGWHIYWNNPGDTGTSTKVLVDSDLATAQLKEQSVPKHFHLHKMITQYAYDKKAYWLFSVIPNQDLKIGDTLHITADAAWLACREECVEETLTLSLDVPVEDSVIISDDWKSEYTNAQATFPQQYATGSFSVRHGKLQIQIPDLGNISPSSLKLIPFEKGLIINNMPNNFNVTDNNLFIDASLQKDVSVPSQFKAIILSNAGNFEVLLKEAEYAVSFPSSNSFILMLLMAFVGGIILNLMPCIFPILFIKSLNLLNNIHSHRGVAVEALFYFVGVVISFMIIAMILWVLRLGGAMIGWGFQLQSPIFVAFLWLLFFIIGLMFLGLIHFHMPFFNRLGAVSLKKQKLNSFFTGLLSVLIASPCSAPFMGSAIGYSMTQPPYIYFPIFLALAIGYALPFTLIGLFPDTFAKMLPRPGKWMVVLKKLFAIPVFVTCLWLGWVFYNQVTPATPAWQEPDSLAWETFSPEKLSSLQQQNRPVFIDFTAKWCLTCLVNEKTALSSKAFKRLVNEQNITLLKADWTSKDTYITSALAQYGRNSVPLYVYYDGMNPQPTILPQLLTVHLLKQYLQKD